mmetsp:Transcript_4279/g.10871  ORF Transcript_4279/g.10871 Transcript_4279/m.10871 type:complete len:314 (+) Transcript_4279:429-1370(+)
MLCGAEALPAIKSCLAPLHHIGLHLLGVKVRRQRSVQPHKVLHDKSRLHAGFDHNGIDRRRLHLQDDSEAVPRHLRDLVHRAHQQRLQHLRWEESTALALYRLDEEVGTPRELPELVAKCLEKVYRRALILCHQAICRHVHTEQLFDRAVPVLVREHGLLEFTEKLGEKVKNSAHDANGPLELATVHELLQHALLASALQHELHARPHPVMLTLFGQNHVQHLVQKLEDFVRLVRLVGSIAICICIRHPGGFVRQQVRHGGPVVLELFLRRAVRRRQHLGHLFGIAADVFLEILVHFSDVLCFRPGHFAEFAS